MTVTATMTQPIRDAAGLAVALTIALAGCILQNPAYDGDTVATEGGSESGGSQSGSATLGDSEGDPICAGDGCLYLDPPPIACFEFEELGATLVDSRECGHDGAQSQVSAVDAVYGGGLRISEGSSLTIPGGVWRPLASFSLSLWVALPSQAYSETMVLLDKQGHFKLSLVPPEDPLTQNWQISCEVVDNKFIAEAAVLYTDGKWHMISCVCVAPESDPGTCEQLLLYRDGKLYQPSETGLSKPTENDSPTAIAPSFRGCIDSLQVWDRALTQAELDALYEAGNAEPNTPCPPP
ncbi:MAG: LamG domain-containing protein [Myxococcales bacterium]|nr:LamG domain-containing protein [Myxococcales bacterium]